MGYINGESTEGVSFDDLFQHLLYDNPEYVTIACSDCRTKTRHR